MISIAREELKDGSRWLAIGPGHHVTSRDLSAEDYL